MREVDLRWGLPQLCQPLRLARTVVIFGVQTFAAGLLQGLDNSQRLGGRLPVADPGQGVSAGFVEFSYLETVIDEAGPAELSETSGVDAGPQL